MQFPTTTSAARSWIRIRRLLRVLCSIAFALAAASAPLCAQGITLPTVRSFGAGPEEAVLYRVVREVRMLLDTAFGGDSVNMRKVVAQRRLNVLMLASLTARQYDGLLRARGKEDALVVLAGSRYKPDDLVPLLLLDAVNSVSDDPSACAGFGDAEQTSIFNALTQRRLPSKNRLPVEGNFRLSCALREIEEREPSRALSGLLSEPPIASRPTLLAKLDTLMRVGTAVVIRRKLETRLFAPIRGREQAAAFWRQRGSSPLNVGSITGSSRSGVAFTELASPLLQAVRMSVNAVLAADKASTESQAANTTPAAQVQTPTPTRATGLAGSESSVQRLLSGGGLVNISLAWPVLYRGAGEGAIDAMLLLVPRFGVTAPVLGATGDDATTVSMDLGVELHTKVLDIKDGSGIVGQVRVANARGANGFVASLGIPDKRSVTYATASVGFLFGKEYMITVSKAFAGPAPIRRPPFQVGLTVLRSAPPQ
jgi:hypothetical protein